MMNLESSEAAERLEELERLYAFGRGILRGDDFQSTVSAALDHIVRVFDAGQACFYDCLSGRTLCSGAFGKTPTEEWMRMVAAKGVIAADQETKITSAPVCVRGETVGSIVIAGVALSTNVADEIVHRFDVALERARALEKAAKAEAARKSEELKSAVLDSLAHDLKTPLTAIKASITTLLADPSAAHSGELLNVINEETDHLNRIVSEAVEMAHLEVGALHLERREYDVKETICAALEAFTCSGSARLVCLDAPDGLPPADIDFRLVKLVLKQLLDNARKYSPDGAPVTISAEEKGGEIVIHLADAGPGVPVEEQSRIFENFYRGSGGHGTTGMGMGLAIARRIIEAHGGKIWVTSTPGTGANFHVALPISGRKRVP